MFSGNAATSSRPSTIRRLTVQLTKYCNLNCYYCYIHPLHGRTVSGIEFDPLILFLQRCRPYAQGSVVLTGGEPLLHPRVDEILQYLSREGFRIALETNGTFINEGRLLHIAKNKGHIAVTFESSSPEKHDKIRGQHGSWMDTYQALRRSSSIQNISTQFTFNLTPSSVREMPDAIALGKELGVSRIKLNPIYRIGPRGSTSSDNKYLSIHSLLFIANEWAALRKHCDFAVDLALPPSFLPPSSRYVGAQCSGCDLGTLLGVLHDGSIRPCHNFMYDGDGTKLGSIYDDYSVPELIKSVKALPGATAWNLEGTCSKCSLLPVCKGFCRAQANSDFGRTTSPARLCHDLHEASLFPVDLLAPEIIANAER